MLDFFSLVYVSRYFYGSYYTTFVKETNQEKIIKFGWGVWQQLQEPNKTIKVNKLNLGINLQIWTE